MKHKVIRKCIVCRELKNREDMLKITKKYDTGELILKPDSKVFGRSVYLCYNETCIKEALKKNKLEKSLKMSISEEFKNLIKSKISNSKV